VRREAGGKEKITDLKEEIDSIHNANRLFWESGEVRSREEIAEYYQRQERLETIRREFAEVISAMDVVSIRQRFQ
jgi:hypothetical protein